MKEPHKKYILIIQAWTLTIKAPKAEARKLEHQYPHALKVKYRGSQH